MPQCVACEKKARQTIKDKDKYSRADDMVYEVCDRHSAMLKSSKKRWLFFLHKKTKEQFLERIKV